MQKKVEPDKIDRPPIDPAAIAIWFAEGVRSELDALEKDGGAQNYEVLSGKLIETSGTTQAIFQFIIADGTRIPEDATGRLKTDGNDYVASVIGQQGNLIHLQIEGKALPLHGITRATLIIDDTVLLRRLAETLEEIATTPANIGPLATTVFHPIQAKVGLAKLASTPSLDKITGELRQVLEQACGSSLTYTWGPPGTGKTRGIAHLIAALVEVGERVLVTSHTHAAVDQALYATVKSETKDEGPLAAHLLVRDGKILRIGRTADPKIPDSVRLDKVLEIKARELESAISQLEVKAKPLAERRAKCRAAISDWDKLTELTNRLREGGRAVQEAEGKQRQARAVISKSEKLLKLQRTELEKAQRAWLWRTAKVERATRTLQEAEAKLRKAEMALSMTFQETEVARRRVNEIEAEVTKQQTICERLPARGLLETKMSTLVGELGQIEEKIHALQEEISKLVQNLVAEARVIFCTLTKNYVGKELEGQRFDAVIVDEISMALPPLIFLVASRANSRVILVGDFLQLPPVVRSDSQVSNARLREDAFHLAGVAQELRAVENCPVLTRLKTQRRMVPPIADVARHLAYGPDGIHDDASVLNRETPIWLNFLPANPLLLVDTADLHCWSGKQPGSLSRFNFYSATVAVELAAMAAAKVPEQMLDEAPPIGIVTPFAAQRRLLSKFLREMNLDRWVVAGTAHTFQGGQADLIVFDSVLDEPYWSARLCAPADSKNVKRDLNVAVTRTKSKFIFIGSSEWLNKHAKPASGLGQMWAFLKDRADLISANELVEQSFHQQVSDHSLRLNGWQLPYQDDGPMHEILDESSFFEHFAKDIGSASKSILGLVPYFGEYRWPRIQPLLNAALTRGVEVTLITPPASEAENHEYVEKAIENLRNLGAVVISAAGLHGKDIIIDERIHYTGSLNWASHRGRTEIMHRTHSPALARLVLQYMQAKYIRSAATHEDGTPRVCPECGCPTQIVNQRKQHGAWDFQPMKVGCAKPECQKYLRNIDERPPFREVPRCQVDGRTKYRRVRRGRGEVWLCPKHPSECKTEKVVPGDPG